ncbi:uncharacterized protein TOT_010001146 [Theileria orientalis strain Shintoku]|uniref:PPPDE domain-containing protein n=1 Tax=Theileria orientalis strain Shintoku TaxID=869250 RepID=J4CCN3_THEOR|nr:uncharacterized protein TOT_010001146 [Theileria orientalis strain Shintoku]PVC52444.1 hypothetical protein MACL_00000752 [Theileria orientalis]BAM39692.1 uncharacterized protein TOT_010001146 [Theileria orientalis strain Shintoku]|eukprot:XP_009689993.1 uncharacterized protein TOT_010001146 [Theileria orientalis strain Shintoku]
MGKVDESSPRFDEIVRTVSSQAACGYKPDSARKVVYDSQLRNDHAQAAKEVVMKRIIKSGSIGNEGRLDHLYGINEILSKDLSPVRVIRIDKRRSNQSVNRNSSQEGHRVIRRGMSDNVTGMSYNSNLKLVRQSSQSSNKSRKESNRPIYGHVYLNIYDLENVNKFVNIIANTIGAAAYHAGVEIYGCEYNFGYTSSGGTGVMQSFPRHHASHVYRKSLDLGRTRFSPEEVKQIVESLKKDWPGKQYNILKRNCLNFADELCVRLEVGKIPEWVMGLQNKINWTRKSLNKGAAKLKVSQSF